MNTLPKTWTSPQIADIAEINLRAKLVQLDNSNFASFIPKKCAQEESGRFTALGDRRIGEVRKSYTPFPDGDVLFAKVMPWFKQEVFQLPDSAAALSLCNDAISSENRKTA